MSKTGGDNGPEQESWVSETGFPIHPVYPPEEIPEPHLGVPGGFPFTRHIYATGYRKRPWAPSLYSGFGTAEEANQRFRYLLSQGNGRANVATDLPTQIGLDSDDPEAAGEVGRVGVAIDSLADFETMFQGVPLDETPVSFNINTVAPIFLAMLVATARRQGVEPAALSGTMANDILHEYVARGTWRYEPESSLRLMADVVEYVTAEMPRFYPFNIRSILLHESGAHPGQEIGFTFAIACRYIDEALERGIPIDDFAPRMSFFFGLGTHLFEEAAKFRAARRLWATLLKERYGTEVIASQKLRITSVAPCGSHFPAADPQLNLVRGTLGVLGGALGGVQAMLGTTIDEAFEIPTEETQRLALRSQQIVALESDVCATVDPLGGSYFVESLTDEIELSARAEMERAGGPEGVVEAIVEGRLQADLSTRAYEIEQERASGARPKVGENIHVSDEPQHLRLHEADPGIQDRSREKLAKLRGERDGDQVECRLDAVKSVAADGGNLIPSLIDAVEAYATLGEISAALDEHFAPFAQPTELRS